MKDNSVENVQAQRASIFGKIIVIGFIGGVVWSALLAGLYYFNFSEVAPKSFLLRPWLQNNWTDGLWGHLLSIILSGIISLIPTFIYYIALKKVYSMWVGIGFGIVLWGLIFLVLQPIIPLTKPISVLSTDTIVTTICILGLYGLFIGYSIAFDYHDMNVRAKKKKQEGANPAL